MLLPQRKTSITVCHSVVQHFWSVLLGWCWEPQACSWNGLSVCRTWSASEVRYYAGQNLQPYANFFVCVCSDQGGVSKAVSAGRLSHIFGLRGGSTNVDTACSASLVGVSTAVQAMRRAGGGQVKAVADKHNLDALCMGINMLTSPWGIHRSVWPIYAGGQGQVLYLRC